MFYILAINPDLMGGGSTHSFVKTAKSILEAHQWIEQNSQDPWSPNYIVTQRVG